MNLGALPSPAKLELRVLGTGEVWQGNQRLHVGHRKTLALLAFLALEGQTARSKLSALFWSDNTEEEARRNLRRELHRLREAGLRDYLEASNDHLSLVGLSATDVQQFEALVAEGRLEPALLLWRGELLADLCLENAPEFDMWLETRRESLAYTLRKVQLEQAERLETKGDWHAALKLNQLVLNADRLQERQHREVMRLQYLLGQREAALAQFEDCKTILLEELGLEPLPDTLHLAQQIRTAQSLTPNIAVQLLAVQPLTVPLIGRADALAALSSSRTPLTLVLAEAGGGKTFLLEVLTPHSLRIRFRAVSSQTPLYAIAEAIREGLRNLEAREKLEALEPIWQLEAARLVPELSNVQSSQAQERSLFLEGLARVLECLTDDNLILEDLHWADTASLELIAHLVRRAARASQQPRLIATARADELSAEARQILESLVTDGFSSSITLSALSEIQVSELVRSLGGQIDMAFSSQLFKVTAGNPFFILETIRYLFEQNELGMHDATWINTLPIPPSVLSAVLNRVDRLGSVAKRLLETAALTEDGFALEEIQPATALSEWEGLEGLEQAVGAQILKRDETGLGFTHDLVRQALHNTLSTERQRLIHAKLAVSLEQAGAAPARVASHLEQAGKAIAAVPWRIKAGEQATQVYAHTQALEQYDQALENGAPADVAFKVLQQKLSIWEMLGQTMPWQADLERLALLTARIHDPIAISQLHLARARLALYQREFTEALHWASLAIAADVNDEIIAQAHVLAGTAFSQQSQLETAERHLSQALDLLPAPHQLRGKVLNQLFQVALDAGDTELAEDHLSSAVQLNQTTRNLLDELGNLSNQGKIALNKGDTDAAVRVFETALQKVKPINNPTLERSITMGLATAYSRLHRLGDALQLLQRALQLAEMTDSVSAQGGIYHTIGAVHRRSTEFGLAAQQYQAALEIADRLAQQPSRIFRRLTLADLYLDLGSSQKALPILQETAAIIEATGVRNEADWCQILLAKQQRLAQQINASLVTLEIPEPKNPLDRVIWLTELAQTRLAAQDFTGVLQLLEGEDAPPNTLSQLLGMRLQALAALEKPLTEELSEMNTLEPELTPLFLLHYHVALTRTHQFTHQTELVNHHQAAARAQVLAMATSLEDYSELKNSFLELHADLI